MKKFSRFVFFILFVTATSAFDAFAASDPIDQQTAEITDVVAQVKQALANVQTTLAAKSLPPLKQVKLSLQTAVAKKVGTSLKLWVITIGGTWEKTKSQQIDLVLTPPKPGGARNISTSVTEALEAAIVSAAIGVKDVGKNPIPLQLSSLEVQMGFIVKSDINGDGKPVITILPVTLDFSGDLSKTAVQQLTVIFATTEK